MRALQRSFWVVVISVLGFSTAKARVEAVIGDKALAQNQNIAMDLPTTDNSEILISRDQYLISYNKNRRAPNWVAWKLEGSQLGDQERTNKFQQDPDLETYLSQNTNGLHAVTSTDFKNSCFDRGHQIPSGDRTDNEDNNAATFMMSNMIPQTPFLNRVIWEHLESYTRSLVKEQGKKVYVIAGPIYDIDFGTIGPAKDIPVPSKDFKIVFILEANQTAKDINQNTPKISVIMPNILKDGSTPVPSTPNCGGSGSSGDDTGASSGNSDDWKQYQTSIADIESKTGLSFHDLSHALIH